MGWRTTWTWAWILAAAAAARGQTEDVLAGPVRIPYRRPARWDVAPLRHDAFISAAGWADGDRRIVSLDGEGLVMCWDSASGRPLYALRAPDGKYLCLSTRGDDTTMALGRSDGVVELRDARNGRLLRSASSEEDAVIAVSWAPKASVVAVALANGKIRRLQFGERVLREDVAHTIGQYRSLDVAADGERIAHVSDLAVLWVRTEPEKWKRVPTLTEQLMPGGQRAVFDGSGERLAVSFYRDDSAVYDGTSGRLLEKYTLGSTTSVTVARNGLSYVWMIGDGILKFQQGNRHGDLAERARQESPFELSSDGTRLIASLSERQLQVFDLETTARVLPGRESVPAVTHLAWSHDAKRLVAAHGDGIVQELDCKDGFRIVESKSLGADVLDLRVASDGRRLALLYRPGIVSVRDLASGAEILRRHVAISPRAACLSSDLTLAVWEKNWLQFEVVSLAGGETLCELTLSADAHLARHPDAHLEVRFAPGNRYLLASLPQEFGVWELSTSKAVARRERDWNHAGISSSEDGLRTCFAESVTEGKAFQFQSAPWPDELTSCRWRTSTGATNLLLGSASRHAILWHSAGWYLFDPLHGNVHREFDSDELTSAALSPDEQHLAGGGRQGQVTIWRIPRLPPLRPSFKRPETLVGDLAGPNLARALVSCRELASQGDAVVPFLRDRMSERPPRERVARFVADLNDLTRQEIVDAGVTALPTLRELEKHTSDPQQRLDLGVLLRDCELGGAPSRTNRQRRLAIHVLELVGSAAARELLKELAAESPSEKERAEAHAALERLAVRGLK